MDGKAPDKGIWEQADPRCDSAENFRWNVLGEGVTIVELIPPAGSITDLRIPSRIQGFPVTRIAFNAFRGMSLTSVTIPDSVTFIGTGAFSNNRLTSIAIPDSVRFIENAAFENNLLTSVTLPKGITSIDSKVFSHNKLTCLTIPQGIVSIGTEAFLDNHLTSLVIPPGVKHIGSRAFEQNRLTSVVIPRGITCIENSVFAFNRLTSVTIPEGVISIENGAFEDNQLDEAVIPASVTSIGDRAFAWNRLGKDAIPDTVIAVGEKAFAQYDEAADFRWKLRADGKSVVITGQAGNRTCIRIPPELQKIPVTEIADRAFAGNELLRRTSVSLPNTITRIGHDAFAHNNLESLVIPDSVISIGTGAFAHNRIASLTLGKGLKAITGSHPRHGSGAFANNSLTTLTIPEGVSHIGDWAFSGNPLTSIRVPRSVTYIGVALPCDAIVSDVYVYEKNFLARFIDNDSAMRIVRYTGMDETVKIPSHIRNLPVTAIGERALEFSFARWAVNIRMTGVTIPDSVVFIEREAFAGQNLASVFLPDSVAYIGSMAFTGNHFSSITIAANVTFLRWPPINDTTGGFGPVFAEFYESQGRRAGRYKYRDGRWSVT